jgi:hypothetical protein
VAAVSGASEGVEPVDDPQEDFDELEARRRRRAG